MAVTFLHYRGELDEFHFSVKHTRRGKCECGAGGEIIIFDILKYGDKFIIKSFTMFPKQP
ncbi:hypothetical protein BWD07_11605 [Neisseria canis]|uniref:hypothetical protein n=1 Tax=Neisseria canis TaxID=493 RepID=UPI000A19539C|nr:hypothetical protein [Neisseria canis]OSI09495.1 hypothetical protein BWD07_11605 [Neisseria canis]